MGQVRGNHQPGIFRVEIDGYDGSINFEYAGPFEQTVGVSVTATGPNMVPVKEPTGKLETPDVELRRPMNVNTDMWNLFKETIDAATGAGTVPEDLWKEIDVVQMAQDHTDLARWRLHNSFAFAYLGGEQDVEGDRAKTEGVRLAVEWIERIDL